MQISAIDKRGLVPTAIRLCATLCLEWLAFQDKATEGNRLTYVHRDELLDLRNNYLLPPNFQEMEPPCPAEEWFSVTKVKGGYICSLRGKSLNFPSAFHFR